MMEIARKLTLEKTLTTHSLVSQVMVVVDIQQAPFVSIHREIVQTMELVLSVHFPGMIASINVMNFGWLYQGLWSILQCFLNQEQKDAIRFIRLQQLKKAIDTDFIPQALGGADTDQWTLASDPILQQYGKPPELPNTPPASVTSPSEDVFFDALQSPTPAQALSIRNSSRSSRSSPSPRPTIQPQDILLFWRKPPVRPTPVDPILSWAGLYLLIRGPVETIAYRFLSQLFIPPRLLTKATLALSATTAALLSTSLATTLDHLNTP
ncbi:hypothetical protein BY458DRAFT_589242 [Sporodiniella umbellata]|nr:hypothetical protein BY458DRAFT_589242 [Sporodiniella umbellata]